MSKKFFGNRKDSFGKKKKTSNARRDILVVLAGLIFAICSVYWLVTREANLDSNLSVDVLFEDESLDPVEDFVTVLDNGTIDQLDRLLFALKSRRLEFDVAPVLLDNYRKIAEVADKIIAHPDRSDAQRVSAALAKLDAFSSAYSVSLQKDLNDPFVVEQFFAASDEFLDDPSRVVARDAHLAKAKGIVFETVGKRFRGGFQSVENSILDLIEKYPDDPVVLENIRTLFTQIRITNPTGSVQLAGKIAAIAENSDSRETQQLARFMKDIIVLYDSGIGNLKMIGEIIVNDDDFISRLNRLNDGLDAGVTIITQLDNAIEFFERQGKYQHALELSERILKNAEQRTDPDGAALAEIVGRNGVQRNSLVHNTWAFETVDKFGDPVNADRFLKRVTMVVFYSVSAANTRPVMETLTNLRQVMFGKNVEFVFVEIGSELEQVPLEDTSNRNWTTLRTEIEQPNEYLKQCPTRRFPYLVLIDKNGNVDSINVMLSNAKTRIEYLLSLN